MRVAIHQPNFFPHYPFFQKMAQVDVFVILRHCQFEKNGYQNRFEYQGQWQTMSVRGGTCSIADKLYVDPVGDWNSIKRRLKMPVLDQFSDCISTSVALTNAEIIRRLARLLDINTRIVVDITTDSKGTQRLVDLCQFYGAKSYLAGRSGPSYMDMSLFERAGIAVNFQQVKPEDQVSVLDRIS